MCSTMDVIKFIWDKDEYKTKNGLKNVIHMSINFIKYIYIYTLNLTIMSLLGTLSIDNGCIYRMCSTMDVIIWDKDEYKTKMG